MTDFVLIHGTTQNPRGWERLARSLEALGHRSTSVDLAGDDERSPADYAEVIAGQVPGDTTAPVVVAHSGSGQVLPAAARRLDAGRQVWLAAYVPDGRHSLRDDVSPAPGEVFNPEWPPPIEPSGPSGVAVPPAPDRRSGPCRATRG